MEGIRVPKQASLGLRQALEALEVNDKVAFARARAKLEPADQKRLFEAMKRMMKNLRRFTKTAKAKMRLKDIDLVGEVVGALLGSGDAEAVVATLRARTHEQESPDLTKDFENALRKALKTHRLLLELYGVILPQIEKQSPTSKP